MGVVMPYELIYLAEVTAEIIPRIPLKNRGQISHAIAERLTADPIGLGKPLQGKYKGFRRLRVGDSLFYGFACHLFCWRF